VRQRILLGIRRIERDILRSLFLLFLKEPSDSFEVDLPSINAGRKGRSTVFMVLELRAIENRSVVTNRDKRLGDNSWRFLFGVTRASTKYTSARESWLKEEVPP